MNWLDEGALFSQIGNFLHEDMGRGDITTQSTLKRSQSAKGRFLAKEPMVVAGLEAAEAVFSTLDSQQQIEAFVADGDEVEAGKVIARTTGFADVLLAGERLALNLMQRLSGIATLTRRYVQAVEGTGARIVDTRKTTPGLRALEKYAVRAGGGTNKRMGLYDVAMIKDNHKLAAGSITAAYRAVRAAYPDVPVQVEVTTPAEAVEAVEAGADFLLCDNMTPELLREVVRAVGDRAELEATGGLSLDTAAAYAATGVDYLSVGGLTHSSPALDLGMDLR